jgi:hypothetical protein
MDASAGKGRAVAAAAALLPLLLPLQVARPPRAVAPGAVAVLWPLPLRVVGSAAPQSSPQCTLLLPPPPGGCSIGCCCHGLGPAPLMVGAEPSVCSGGAAAASMLRRERSSSAPSPPATTRVSTASRARICSRCCSNAATSACLPATVASNAVSSAFWRARRRRWQFSAARRRRAAGDSARPLPASGGAPPEPALPPLPPVSEAPAASIAVTDSFHGSRASNGPPQSVRLQCHEYRIIPSLDAVTAAFSADLSGLKGSKNNGGRRSPAKSLAQLSGSGSQK